MGLPTSHPASTASACMRPIGQMLQQPRRKVCAAGAVRACVRGRSVHRKTPIAGRVRVLVIKVHAKAERGA